MAHLQHISTGRRFIMQSKTLHSYPGSCLEFSPFSGTPQFKKVVRVKVESKVSLIPNQAFINSSLQKHRFKLSLSCASQHKLRNGLSSSMIATFIPGDGLSYTDALGRRLFSNVPRPVTLKKSSKEAGDNLSIEVSNNIQKQAKSLSAYGRNGTFTQAPAKRAPMPCISVAKDIGMATSKDELEGSKEGAKLDKSTTPKKKQPSRRKSKLQQQPESKNDEEQILKTSGSAAKQKVSRKSSKTKKSTMAKHESVSPSENSSVTNASSEVLESIDGSLPVAKKKSPRRRKSNKEANAQTDSSQLSQNKKPQMHEINNQKGQKTLPPLYPPISKSVVVVESVTKAKVIQGYLGDMYEVLPSYGHVRDLAARSGSVRPDDDFSMMWEVPSASWTHLKSINVALSGAKNIILASDPDREGEAIAWHIIEMLRQQDALHEDVTVSRVVFSEITESAIKSALQSPRHIDVDLVNAYLARRALDYLIGFSISPLLWRKLPGCQSAGRVQSAALSLLCDRETEIDHFRPQEYWSVEVKFQDSANSLCFPSDLTHLNGKKLDQLSVSSNTEAADIKNMVTSSSFEVLNSKRSQSQRNSPMPFITSTLQQDAANKFGFSAASTMKLAQKLYEGVRLSGGEATGLITYMRTDGLHISGEAEKEIQSFVKERYGHDFAIKGARKYFKTVKNAQEAHEAIRPTNIRRLPSTLVTVLDEDSLKLYTLIWSRTMACQMESATIDLIQLDIRNSDKSLIFRSSCSKISFLGYQAVREDVETSRIRVQEDETNSRHAFFQSLSNLKLGDSLSLSKVELYQHHTQPPSRYSEGSLIKKLEELGIGRPSTYASTIKVLKDRNYVTVKGRTLHPEFRGRMVSAYLSHYFSEVTDYTFTADMESELDNVSGGLTEWKDLLKDYWTRFSKYCEHAGSVHIHQVEKMLEKTFSDFLFSSLPGESRACPSCKQGTLIFKVSRFGAGYFIGCDQHPQCKYIAKTLYGEEDDDITSEESNKNVDEPKLLGLNPGSNEKVLLKNGPYGYYVQLGEDRKGHLPKRASVSQVCTT
ncbi:hypothetical protein Leryth_002976 [Lithospermum erythrorhizon]|nr:hypothetical protein Leryth_002976 [Lithospermum erythrorhizon]